MTALMIEQLENGNSPVLQAQEAGVSYLPFNPSTQNTYSGITALYLMSVAEQFGYSDTRWLTQKQAEQLGAHVLSEAEGVPILYWKTTERRPQQDNQGNLVRDAEGQLQHETVKLENPQLASALVFNGELLLNLPSDKPSVQARKAVVEQLVKASLPGRSKDLWNDLNDNDPGALKTLAQQLLDSNRVQHPVGSVAQAKAALTLHLAELFLGGKLETGYTPDTTPSERRSWIKLLKADPNALFQIAKTTEQITQHVMQQTQEQVLTRVQAPEPNQRQTQTPLLPMRSSERFYIEVDYHEKAQAKALGAKWDRQARSWYVPPGKELDAFAQWPAHHPGQQMSLLDLDPIQQFERTLKAEGLLLQGAIQPAGKLVRVSVEGDKANEKSGAYVYYGDGHPAGFIQNYKTGISYNWKADTVAQSLSAVDRARLEAEAAEKQKIREQERAQIAEQLANRILDFLTTCPSVDTHPYLAQKGVAAYGLRLNTHGPLVLLDEQSWGHAGDLMVPVFNVEKQLISAQAIGAGGRKSFPAGAQMEGGNFVIGNLTEASCVLLAEGYSTAATLYELSGGLPVVVTFSAGNMPAVAKALHAQYPDKRLLMAGDNEHTKPISKNVGLQKASEAARWVGGSLLLPEFPHGAKGTDWNDLVQLKGVDSIRQELKQAIQVAVVKAEKNRVLNLPVVHRQSKMRESAQEEEKTLSQRKSRSLRR